MEPMSSRLAEVDGARVVRLKSEEVVRRRRLGALEEEREPVVEATWSSVESVL